jgi:predicted ribosome quality control (RQC) complex YloA/Tae2 family protein
MRTALLLALLMSCSAPAFALYKCGSDGKITYSDLPCTNGKTLNTFAAGAAAEAGDSQQRLAADKAEAHRLEQARHQREDKEERAQRRTARAAASQHKKCRSLALHQRWAQEDARKAAGKAADKASTKARRAAEKFELSCGK